MTQKERLVELLEKSQWTIKDFPVADLDTFVHEINDWLSEYLISNGVIVLPLEEENEIPPENATKAELWRWFWKQVEKRGET